MTQATRIAAFLHDTCTHAQRAQRTLLLEECGDGWRWAWSHGPKGDTTARTQPVGLLMACQSYHDMPVWEEHAHHFDPNAQNQPTGDNGSHEPRGSKPQ